MHLDIHFLSSFWGFWACLQTGVNVILLVPGTNLFRSVYQIIDFPSVSTMQHIIMQLSHSEASCSDVETIEEMVVLVFQEHLVDTEIPF